MIESERTAREIFLTALEGGRPERVPIFDFICSQNLIEHFTGHRPTSYDIPDVMETTLKLGFDAAFIPFGGFKGYTAAVIREEGDKYVDEWGTTYQRSGASWPVDAPVDYPIKGRADFRGWRAPDPTPPSRLDPVRTAVRMGGGRVAILGGLNGPLTVATLLIGFEGLAYSLYDDPGLVREIFRIATDYALEGVRSMAGAGADGICLAEDMGFKTRTLISPDHCRGLLFPFLSEIVSEAHRHALPVLLHSDGRIGDILDDLVQMGIDGYNPIERGAGMDIVAVKRRYPRLCLVGNVNSATALAGGTPDDVRREVIELLQQVAPGGAYVLCSDSDLRNDMPIENILAMVETGRQYGRYPIQIPS